MLFIDGSGEEDAAKDTAGGVQQTDFFDDLEDRAGRNAEAIDLDGYEHAWAKLRLAEGLPKDISAPPASILENAPGDDVGVSVVRRDKNFPPIVTDE